MVSIERAIQILKENGNGLREYKISKKKGQREKINVQGLPTQKDEIVVFGDTLRRFNHSHAFFVIYFAWQGNFLIQTKYKDQPIVLSQGQAYMALPSDEDKAMEVSPNSTCIRIFVERQTFFKSYFHALASNPTLFQFFNQPSSSSGLLISFSKEEGAGELVELICREYVDWTKETDFLLKSLVFSFILMIGRNLKEKKIEDKQSLIDCILEDILTNYQTITLNDLASKYDYHPAYLSTTIHQQLGKTFSQIVLEQRMKNAEVLLLNSSLTLEEISQALGYAAPSNFYRSFRAVYGISPRQFLNQKRLDHIPLDKIE